MRWLLFIPALIFLWSCKKGNNSTLVTAKPVTSVVVLGNSITYSPANPSIGWNGNWGMAASAVDKDYIHLLTAHLKATNPASTLAFTNIAAFENNFDTYNFDDLKSLRDAKPNILILRIGENVTRSGTADSVLFDKKYADLINYFKTNNPQLKILAVGSVWPQRELANTVMRKYSDFISLVSLQSDLSNFAFGLYPDPGIQAHPSDKGMNAISDQIWVKLSAML